MSEWCLIESDPGVFTELISSMGVQGVQVEEVYSLDDETLESLGDIYGLIFLFKYDKRHKELPPGAQLYHDNAESLFFAHQVITNACATQAILGILMNAPLSLGETLQSFKTFVSDFPPDMKGLALSNSDEIRKVHNSFARAEPFIQDKARAATEDDDLFHFTAIIPNQGKVLELDGLRETPLDYGTFDSKRPWWKHAQPLLQARMDLYASSEIRFNLMAVVQDRQIALREKLALYANHSIMQQEIQHQLEHEEQKRARYKTENARRRHNFVPLAMRLLQIMSTTDVLEKQYNAALAKTKS